MKTKILYILFLAITLTGCKECSQNSQYLVFPQDDTAVLFISNSNEGLYTQGLSSYFINIRSHPFTYPRTFNNDVGLFIIAEPNHDHVEEAVCPNPKEWDLDEYWRYTDFRLKNGWNNWREQSEFGADYKGRLYIEKTTINGGPVNNDPTGPQPDTKEEYFLSTERANSPPAYLHLVLQSLNEISSFRQVGGYIQKIWVVDTIKDLNGAIVTNDPDWVCYSDNEYVFRKNSTVRYRPGPNICPTDQLLQDKGLSEIWINYTIRSQFMDFDNPGKITMEFKVPEPAKEFVDDFSVEIINSNYDRAVFRITKDSGEQADLILSPM